MRSFVTEPMQYGRLYLAATARTSSATRRQGNELAFADVRMLVARDRGILQIGKTEKLRTWLLASRVAAGLEGTTFSWWMTSLLQSLSRTRTPSTGGGRSPNLNISQFARPPRRTWRRIYSGLPIASLLRSAQRRVSAA